MRFGKESVLIQIYIKKLLKLAIAEKSKLYLVKLYDKIQTQSGALESLGLIQYKFCTDIIPLCTIEFALPKD